jgi:geranylgeranyl reductase family protein
MKRAAVLGGGPAGAFAAERLAEAGWKVVVIDEKLAWEKPCGGGLTCKAYTQYPFLLDNDTPKKLVTRTVMAAAGAGSVVFPLCDPLVVYSRYELNGLLLERAARAGAQIEKARVREAQREGAGWRVHTTSGVIDADYCIVAMGARNPMRELGTQLGPEDTMTALGYYIPGQRDHIHVQFPAQFEGYIWVFPRCGHLSVGICGRGQPAQALRQRLEDYLRDNGIDWKGSPFYSHLLPSLRPASWRPNRVSGEGWMAVGDAAGLVDPITGEGLYYAIRSADIAARALATEGEPAAGETYRRKLWREIGADLEFAARIASRVYLGTFLFRSVPARMIQFTRYSGTFSGIMQDLFAGRQAYLGLKERLWGSLPRTLAETAAGILTKGDHSRNFVR